MRALPQRASLVAIAATFALIAASCAGSSGDTSDVSTTVVDAGPTQAESMVADLEGTVLELEQTIQALETELATATSSAETIIEERDAARSALNKTRLEVLEWKGEALKAVAELEKAEEVPVETTTTTTIPTMEQPKRDGFYTVGFEIAPGTWESSGTADDCYWEVLDSDQDIIKNHFGNAGGRVKISKSADEFHAQDCGTWTYQG